MQNSQGSEGDPAVSHPVSLSVAQDITDRHSFHSKHSMTAFQGCLTISSLVFITFFQCQFHSDVPWLTALCFQALPEINGALRETLCQQVHYEKLDLCFAASPFHIGVVVHPFSPCASSTSFTLTPVSLKKVSQFH